MPFRHPTVSSDAHDLIIRIPLENIPNMPRDPQARAIVLHHLQGQIGQYMDGLAAKGLHPAAPKGAPAPSPMAAPPMTSGPGPMGAAPAPMPAAGAGALSSVG